MITQIVKGDLIEMYQANNRIAIAHGCNCMCTMGTGVALAIKNAIPEAYRADMKTKRGDRLKLGTFTYSLVGRKYVFNLYTQLYYGYKGVHLDYTALGDAFKAVNDYLVLKGYDTLYIPKIGAGAAGGNWNSITSVINQNTPDIKIVVVEYNGG